jgi:uncharacterized protein YPO0396
VLKAKDQVARLQPLVADCARHAELIAQVDDLRGARDALKAWFADIKAALLEKRLVTLGMDANASMRASVCWMRRGRLWAQRDQLKRDIAENGGNRLAWIGTEISCKEAEKQRRLQRAERYAELAKAIWACCP